MKKQVVIIVSVALVSLLVGTMFTSNYLASGAKPPSVWDVINALQAQVNSLNNTVIEQQAQIAELQAQVNSLNNTLIEQQTQISELKTSDLSMSGSLIQLPYFAKWQIGEYLEPYVILLSLDIDQSKLGDQQTIFVARTSTHTITVTGTFQIYSPDHVPGDIGQVFFIYSWTPSWPPANGFYHALYDGQPGVYPGQTRSFSFDITIPSTQYGRVLYLYFCGTFQYTMEDAVSLYTKPLWVPYAVITVGP